MLWGKPLTKGLVDVVINLPPCHVGQVICGGIIFELELGPYDKVHNLLVNPIWPVVVEDLDVIWQTFVSTYGTAKRISTRWLCLPGSLKGVGFCGVRSDQ